MDDRSLREFAASCVEIQRCAKVKPSIGHEPSALGKARHMGKASSRSWVIELKKINKEKFQAEKKREEKENIAFFTVRTVRYAQPVRSKEKTVSQRRQTKHCIFDNQAGTNTYFVPSPQG
jgi:hypothetical protein